MIDNNNYNKANNNNNKGNNKNKNVIHPCYTMLLFIFHVCALSFSFVICFSNLAGKIR